MFTAVDFLRGQILTNSLGLGAGVVDRFCAGKNPDEHEGVH